MELYDLPPGWAWTTLGDIVNIKYGKNLPTTQFTDVGYPVFGANGLIGFYTHYLYEEEQVLISCRGANSGVVNYSPPHCFITNNSLVLELKSKTLVLKRYLFHVLQDVDKSSIVTGSAQPQVTINNVLPLPIPLPPLPEQERIVEAIEAQLSRIEAGVASVRNAQSALRRYKASVLNAACTGQLLPQDPTDEPATLLLERILAERRARWEADQREKYAAQGKPLPKNWQDKYPAPAAPDTTDLPELPQGWVWGSVEQTTSTQERSMQSGPFGSQLLHSEFQEEGVLAIGIDNVLNGAFSMGSEHRISRRKFGELRKFQARPLDVLITVMATVGRACVVPSDLETAIITKHVYRISVNFDLLSPYYLMHCLIGSSFVRNQIFGNVQGQTRPGINGAILKRLIIPAPPLAEQSRIVAEVERRLSVVAALEQAIADTLQRAARLRQSVLRKAFRGELVGQEIA